MQEDQLLKNRLTELANRAYEHNQYTFTDFLNITEIAALYQYAPAFAYVPFTLCGGYGNSERQMARFGSAEALGYEMPFPISCIWVQPLIKKFADEFSHRDFLGALMNLGIERNTIGDIVVRNQEAYVFCTEIIAPYICDSLDQVKHTHVKCSLSKMEVADAEEEYEQMEEIVSSVRIDVVLCKIYHLSRSQSLELFRGKKVFVNSLLCENNGCQLKKGDVVAARGFGKMVYEGVLGETKKEKLRILVKKYR